MGLCSDARKDKISRKTQDFVGLFKSTTPALDIMSILGRKILLTGAKGVVGKPLHQAMLDEGYEVLPISRKGSDRYICWDMNRSPLPDKYNPSIMISCSPIWCLSGQIEHLAQRGLKRLIAFSSTSVLTKRRSKSEADRRIAKQIIAAETKIRSVCKACNIALTIIRPTMIYGLGRDQNIFKIAKFIAKWRVAVVAGGGSGLRQPVHTLDLVKACLKIINDPNSYNKAYNLAGPKPVKNSDMMALIAKAMGKASPIISIPVPILRLGLIALSFRSKFPYSPAMADRMVQDMSFDITPAKIDFGYSPRPFLSDPLRDLPGLTDKGRGKVKLGWYVGLKHSL